MVLLLKHLVKPAKPCFYLLRLHLSTCADQQAIKSISAFNSRLNACTLVHCFVIYPKFCRLILTVMMVMVMMMMIKMNFYSAEKQRSN